MKYTKCCRNCEHAYLESCKNCSTFGDNAYENFELRKELAKIESGKLVELPLIVKTKSGLYVVWIENFITTDTNALQGDFCVDKFPTKEAAEAKLAELRGEK